MVPLVPLAHLLVPQPLLCGLLLPLLKRQLLPLLLGDKPRLSQRHIGAAHTRHFGQNFSCEGLVQGCKAPHALGTLGIFYHYLSVSHPFEDDQIR
jgi:hypothetical protein